MRGIRFFLVCERPSVALHAFDKEENGNGSKVWVTSSQPITSVDTDHGTLTAAGFVRHSEEM
jgi:hypothetical protein